MATILWDHDTFDWQIAQVGPAQSQGIYVRGPVQTLLWHETNGYLPNQNGLITNATSGAFDQQGIIVLTHEIDGFTMNMSETMLPKVSQAFQYVTPAGVCNNNTHPYVEREFRYPVCLPCLS
jgi:hypothetical protein